MRLSTGFSSVLTLLVLVSLLSGCSDGGGSSPTDPGGNLNPIMESINGPDTCRNGATCTYRFRGYDPDGTTVAFHVNVRTAPDLGLVEQLGWTRYVSNHEILEYPVEWRWGPGNYSICVHAKDAQNLESPDSGHVLYRVTVSD